jgi:pimeloyl-ACP methyl ester carboxylesterase
MVGFLDPRQFIVDAAGDDGAGMDFPGLSASQERYDRSGNTIQRSVIEMTDRLDLNRRRLIGAAAFGIATAPLAGAGRVLAATAEPSPQPAAPRSFKPGMHSSFADLRRIEAGDLEIGYAEIGPSDGPAVLLLHGWPYDIRSYVDVAPLLAAAGYRVIVPYLRGYGTTRFLSAGTPRNGQQAAVAVDAIALMDALKIRQAIVAGYDWGGRTADIVAALWPERCKALVSVSGYLIGSAKANELPLPPAAELAWWYQFYFATERGRLGYDQNRRAFAKLIWQTASPQWAFDDATFERSAAAFDNPDHVAIVIHNYRWRLGLAEGEARYDTLERRLAEGPTIAVPTITLEGDANGAPHPEAASYAKKFSGKYQHRVIGGGVGHNLPQEAPEDFAQAVIDADRL